MFDAFRETLDEQNDRFERLVKLSRDLTIQSKRIIFLLHRVAGQYSIGTSPISVNPSSPASTDAIHDDASPLPESARAADLEAVKQAQQKFEDLKPLFAKIANELVDQEADRYMRAMSVMLATIWEPVLTLRSVLRGSKNS
jgi:predicted translin family RNA/ssDNA-binding protein